MAWWQEMAQRNNKSDVRPVTLSRGHLSTGQRGYCLQRANAAKIIQSHFRRSTERSRYVRLKNAICFLQSAIRAWLRVKNKSCWILLRSYKVQGALHDTEEHSKPGTYMCFMIDRYYFVKMKNSAVVIQRATRSWISRRNHNKSILHEDMSALDHWTARSVFYNKVALVENTSVLPTENATDNRLEEVAFQLAWRESIARKSLQREHLAAIEIQCRCRGWLMRKSFINQKLAILKLQSIFRAIRCWKDFQQYRTETMSAIIIQSHIRGWIARKRACRHTYLIVMIQSHIRGWSRRKEFVSCKEAVERIQSVVRCMKEQSGFLLQRHVAIEIQRFIRGEIARMRLLGATSFHKMVKASSPTSELKIFLQSVLKLQRWWRGILLSKMKRKSAVVIQSHVRGWIARQELVRDRRNIIMIQSHWKGYLARKGSRGRLQDLCLRIQKSAVNIDDSTRIINRLVAALSELMSMRSVSGILHTCATLDMATEYSQRCCEELVGAGAINTLLKLIRSVSRSIPDQEVLKHALSTLRNLSRYPHLVEVLINICGSVEVILWEFLRNKEEGYFIASELLKKICTNRRGVETVLKSPALVKRLYNFVDDLSRKAKKDKRTSQGIVARELVDRRFKEASELLELIRTSNGNSIM